jgi:type II secretory pathway component GspD/PulD (secretin)
VPIIDKRSASTKVIVGNGQTLIIGGLIKDKKTNGATKVPFLGDLPFLGYLFKSKKETTDKTELLIFVSPTIIIPEEFGRMAREEKYGIGRDYARERASNSRLLEEREEKEDSGKHPPEAQALNKIHSHLIEEKEKLVEKALNQEEKGQGNAAALRKKAIEESLPPRRDGVN